MNTPLPAAVSKRQMNVLIAIMLAVLILAAFTFYLTPDRVNRKVNGAKAGAAVIQAASTGDARAQLTQIRDDINAWLAANPGGAPSTTTSISSSTTTSSVPATSSSTSPTTLPPSTTTTPASTTSSTVPSSTSSSSTVPPTVPVTQPPNNPFPDAANSGVPTGTSLTTYTGSCTIPAGTVIDAKTINCSTISTGTNVTITRSKILGNAFSVVRPGSGLTMSDVDLTCNGAEGSYGINGGSNGMFTRLNVHDCENAIEPGSGTTFQDSYVHNLRASGAPHYDGVSIDGGSSNITIRHNTIEGGNLNGATSAIMVDNYFGGLTGIVLDRNKVSGGQYTIYADGAFNSNTCRVTMTGNVVTKGNYGYALIRGACQVTQSGNTNNTGQAITL